MMRCHVPSLNFTIIHDINQLPDAVTIGSHMQITGEVKNILADESILNEKGRILLDRLRPIIYDEEQVQYLALGKKAANAFRPGMEMKKSFNGGKDHE